MRDLRPFVAVAFLAASGFLIAENIPVQASTDFRQALSASSLNFGPVYPDGKSHSRLSCRIFGPDSPEKSLSSSSSRAGNAGEQSAGEALAAAIADRDSDGRSSGQDSYKSSYSGEPGPSGGDGAFAGGGGGGGGFGGFASNGLADSSARARNGATSDFPRFQPGSLIAEVDGGASRWYVVRDEPDGNSQSGTSQFSGGASLLASAGASWANHLSGSGSASPIGSSGAISTSGTMAGGALSVAYGGPRPGASAPVAYTEAVAITETPEPSSLALFGTALSVLPWALRRRRK